MAQNPFQNYIVRYSPGDLIFTEGDIGTTMFVLQNGLVRLFKKVGGEEKTLGMMEKGDFFGEMSVLEGLPRTVSAQAVEECELIEINSMTFDRMIRGNIEIAVRMLRKLSIRLREAEKAIEELQSAGPAAARAAEAPVAGRAPAPVPPASAAPPARAPAASPPSAAAAAPPRPPQPPRPAVSPRPAPPAPARPPATGPTRAAAPPAAASAVAAPARPAPSASPAGLAGRRAKAGPRLVSASSDAVFQIREGESLIGRYDPVTETQPEVDLTPLDIKRSVSRQHARITSANGNYFVTEEVGALNGTFLNGARLVTGRPTPLKDGDQLSLGTVQLVFHI